MVNDVGMVGAERASAVDKRYIVLLTDDPFSDRIEERYKNNK